MSDSTPMWSICPRCQVRIAGGCVYFSHRPDLPSDGKTLARKVCQWAYAADLRDGKIGGNASRPIDCLNPVYEAGASYGPYDSIPPVSFTQAFMNPLKELDIDDEKLLSKAIGEVVKILGLGPETPITDPLQLIRLYDNLATVLGGDQELMRHWMGEKNKHLGFEPRTQVHNEECLCEMNGYLEGFRYH